MSAGWGEPNRVHVFWDSIAGSNEQLYDRQCWYDHCESRGELDIVCYKWYVNSYLCHISDL